MFSIGPWELVIILLVGIITFGVPIAIVLAVVMSQRRSRGTVENWKSRAKGAPVSIRSFGPADQPISSTAEWQGTELVVSSNEWSSKALFDLPIAGVEQCLLTYRCRIMSEQNGTQVYPEMWCRIPDKGLFFSRGIDRKIRGAVAWNEVEISFFLDVGQRADLLHLNLNFERPGMVRIKDIEVLSTPMMSAT